MKAGLKEKDVKFNIKELFKKYDVWYFMPSMNGYGRAGVPDFIACYRGYFIAVEAKKNSKEEPTENQKRELKAIHQHAGIRLIIHDENLYVLEQWLIRIESRFTATVDFLLPHINDCT